MTEIELDNVEKSVGFELPASYREVALKQPFRAIAGDAIYWFSDQPNRIISETLCPMANEEYDLAGWNFGYLAIGYSACGDVYILDTLTDSLPVHELSHETHQIEKAVWATFDDFVQEWLRIPDEVARAAAVSQKTSQAEQAIRMRRGMWFVAVIFGFCLLALLILSLFVKK